VGKRRYDQYCALARALDVVGERWTLLLVRELLLGPKRYTDLLEGLPGIGTNLLASRLRELERNGVIERVRLAPPAASTVYELTEYGRRLEPAVIALTQWGGRRLGQPKQGEHFRPEWLAIAMQASYRPDAAVELRESYELRIDETVLHVRVEDGAARIREEEADAPAVIARTNAGTFLSLLFGHLAPADTVSGGQVQITGDPAAFERCIETFAFRLAEGVPS
jgi:DNA-binding HxlR family transcriptional regulator